jgi:hypothetical protein
MGHVKCGGFIEDLYKTLGRELAAARSLGESAYKIGMIDGVKSAVEAVDCLVDANGFAKEEEA